MTKIFMFYLQPIIVTNIMILFVICLRILLRNQSNILKCVIWCFLLIRLLLPLSFEVNFGIFSNETVLEFTPYYSSENTKKISGFTSEDSLVKTNTESENKDNLSENPVIIMIVWYSGMLVFIALTLYRLYFLKKYQKNSTKLSGFKNVYQWPDKLGACVIGIFKPAIYVPNGLSQVELDVIIQHENMHIKRFDHLFILGYYFALCINWYNPLCWLVYFLVQQDIECACDEQVLRYANTDERKKYAQVLLRFHQYSNVENRQFILSFGNKPIKKRIVNIGKKYKPKKILICIVTIICALAIGTSMFFYSKINYHDLAKEMGKEKIGAHIPDIVYVDKDKVAFYDHHGLFVYEFAAKEIKGFVSFEEINMTTIEGENATTVISTKTGDTFYVTDYKKMYIYDYKKNELLEEKKLDNSIMSDNEKYIADIDYDSAIQASSLVYTLSDGTKCYWLYKGNSGLLSELNMILDKNGDITIFPVFE